MYKICTKCGAEKSHTEFSKNRSNKDELQSWCKTCDNKRRKKYHEDNRDKKLEYMRNYRRSNHGKVKTYLNIQKRRAIKLKASVPLTENEQLALQILIEEALLLGDGWHLDHIVPLSKGGLHHPDNLQIVRASYNLSKNNKIWQYRKYV